jgi:ribosomal protein S18 acetylase RimI-like enzyme
VEVRPCTEHDLAQLRERWPTFDDVAGWHHRQQRDGATTFLVCWRGDEPLGYGVLHWDGCVGDNARAAFPSGVEVNHLQVRPGSRGRGAGTALLGTAEERARARGAGQLAVSVAPDNAGAARLYRRLGFRPTGIVDVCSYSWADDQGNRHHEVESSELLVKPL